MKSFASHAQRWKMLEDLKTCMKSFADSTHRFQVAVAPIFAGHRPQVLRLGEDKNAELGPFFLASPRCFFAPSRKDPNE